MLLSPQHVRISAADSAEISTAPVILAWREQLPQALVASPWHIYTLGSLFVQVMEFAALLLWGEIDQVEDLKH